MMLTKNLNSETVKTQTLDSVRELLVYLKRPIEPIPAFIELNGNIRLTKSSKGDCYYTTTLKECSCKARVFNPGKPCKHMALVRAEKDNEIASESLRPTCKWPGGLNGPVDELVKAVV